MPIKLLKRKRDEAEFSVVDEWEGKGALSNISYYLSKHIDKYCDLTLEITNGGMEETGKRKVRRSVQLDD